MPTRKKLLKAKRSHSFFTCMVHSSLLSRLVKVLTNYAEDQHYQVAFAFMKFHANKSKK